MSELFGPDNRPVDAERQETHMIGDCKMTVFAEPTVVSLPIAPDAIEDVRVPPKDPEKVTAAQGVALLSQHFGIAIQMISGLVREVARLREQVQKLPGPSADGADDHVSAPQFGPQLSDKPGGDSEGPGDADVA